MKTRMDRRGMDRGQAFDAAGASGQAFLTSMLELIDTDVVTPLQETTHGRDLPIKTGGGAAEFTSAFAVSYSGTGSGLRGLQGTASTDIPEAQVDSQKGTWPVFPWASSITLKWYELERMKLARDMGLPTQISLQEMFEESVSTIWAKDCDLMAYRGFQNNPGLVNNPNVPSAVVNTGAGGKTPWAFKTGSEMLTDINFALNQTIANSGYNSKSGCADSLLLPYPQWSLMTAPITIGGVGYDSIRSYVERNCIAAQLGLKFSINPLPNAWVAGAGLAGLDRGVAYRNDPKSLVFRIPMPMRKGPVIATSKDGGAWQTIYQGALGVVNYKRTTTQFYLDGI